MSAHSASYDAPYAGLRVLDLSQGIAGPYAPMLLAAHGAGVIKVAPPGGDWARRLGRRYGDQTAFSIAGNPRVVYLSVSGFGQEILAELATSQGDPQP